MNYLIARVSDPDQRVALPAQKQRLYDYAEKQGWNEDVDFVYVEFDETAFKDTRKKFAELVTQPLLASEGLSIVVFDKIDRFSRDSSSEEKALLTKLFRSGKIEMHFPSDNLYVHKNSPAADLFRLDIGVALAGYYSSSIRDNVKRRFDQKLRDGEWPGKAPIGYINYVKGKDAKGDDIKDIKRDDERDYHILRGFELRSTAMPYREIAKQVKKEGLVSNTALRKPITAGQWEEILNNPFYIGKMRYMGKLYPHNYGAIVPMWLWDKCQEVKNLRSNGRTNYQGKQFLFRNLKCSVCAYSVTFDGPKHNGRTYAKCTEYGGKHGARWIDEELLINQVKDVLASLVVPKKVLPDIVKEIERNHASEQEHYKSNVKRLRKEHDDIDEEIKDLFRDRKQFSKRPDLFEQMVNELEAKQKDIQEQLADHGKADKQFIISAAYILTVCSRAVELFEADSTKLDQKRYLISFVLSNITLDGETLNFTLKEPFDAVASMSKSQSWLPLADILRSRYYKVIVDLSKELKLAQSYLGEAVNTNSALFLS